MPEDNQQVRTKKLEDIGKDEYTELKRLGFLWEFYPKATGDYKIDTNTNKEDNRCT